MAYPQVEEHQRFYRACDRRFPFLWWNAEQRPGRWHDVGEGPCHYLATSAKGAWAEVLRHEGIVETDDLVDLECALWEVVAKTPTVRPDLPDATLTGDESSYPACRHEARRLRHLGHAPFAAPSAALLSQSAETFGVTDVGQVQTGAVESETIVIFGPPVEMRGSPLAEGHPEPTILTDVRHL